MPAPPGSQPDIEPKKRRQGREPELLPIERQPGHFTHTLQPVFYRPGFWLIQLLPLLVIGYFYYSRQQQIRLERDPLYARSQRARRELKRQLELAAEAAQAGTAPTFYRQAQRTLQEALGPFIAHEPESLTAEEITEWLRKQSKPEAFITKVQSYFEASEALRFGGEQHSSHDLQGEFNQLKSILTELEH